ncbi:hypothetical protein VitviT2T_012591 [Vitis vinifera]|uniref:Phytosulfokine n=2 Tax=Vitis vinifera TaxID=29760 RepID=A0ABY9CGP5_VITVI|eukprot:XP_003632753.1 PREDICTED: putative phytosulfokines 6 [Vitis vinifera]
MKQNSWVFIIFTLFLFLLYSYSGSARLLATKQDEQVVMGEWMTHAGTSKGEDVLNLMGLEKCHENDEECLKRRMVAEAHLDYIYTQHHKP